MTASPSGEMRWVRGPAVAISELISLGRRGSSEVGDVLRDGVAGSDAGHPDVRGLSGLAEGVVARVEIFALL